MTDLLVDYAWQHPDPVAIKACGYVGAMRYLSNDPSKDLTAEEKAAFDLLGLHYGVVWETLADPLGTDPVAAGRTANAKADALGLPRTMAIYYAFDYNVPQSDWDAGERWLRAAFVGPRSPGVYGPRLFIEEMFRRGAARYLWQAGGSSSWEGGANGQVSAVAHLYQRLTPTLPPPAAPGSYDENVVLIGDWGQAFNVGSGGGTSLPGSTPTTPVPPRPLPDPPPPYLQKDDQMVFQYANQEHTVVVDASGNLVHRFYPAGTPPVWGREVLATGCTPGGRVGVDPNFTGNLHLYAARPDGTMQHCWWDTKAAVWAAEVLA